MAQDGTEVGSVEPATGAGTTDRASGRRTRRPAGVRVFSSASDAARSRRPTDWIMLALAAGGLVALSFPAPGPTAIDTAATNLVEQLPGLAGWFWEAAYALLVIWSLVLVGLSLFAHGRKRLFFYEVLAGAIALGAAMCVTIGACAGPVLAEDRGRLGRFIRGGESRTLKTGAPPELPPPTRDLSFRDAFQAGEDA